MKKKAEKIAERVSYEEDRQKGTGIHRSLDAMRRSSAETLERIRANETQRRLTVDGNIRGAHNSGSLSVQVTDHQYQDMIYDFSAQFI